MFVALFNVFGDEKSLKNLSQRSSTRFPQCSGYHVRLTRGRSPVRAWPETFFFIFLFIFCSFFCGCMSRFLYELFQGILHLKDNDSQVIITLTSKITIIEGLNSLLFPPSLKDTNIVGKPLKMYNDIYVFMQTILLKNADEFIACFFFSYIYIQPYTWV